MNSCQRCFGVRGGCVQVESYDELASALKCDGTGADSGVLASMLQAASELSATVRPAVPYGALLVDSALTAPRVGLHA